MLTLAGICFCSCVIVALTASATATVFVARLALNGEDDAARAGEPAAIDLLFCTSSSTRPKSPRRTGAPLR